MVGVSYPIIAQEEGRKWWIEVKRRREKEKFFLSKLGSGRVERERKRKRRKKVERRKWGHSFVVAGDGG